MGSWCVTVAPLMYWAILAATSNWSGRDRKYTTFTHTFWQTTPLRRSFILGGDGRRTRLRRLGAAEHVPPRSVEERGAVAIVEGAEVLGDRVGAWWRRRGTGFWLEVQLTQPQIKKSLSRLEDKNRILWGVTVSHLIGKNIRCSPAFPAIKPCRSVTLQETGAFTKNASGAVFTQRHHQEAHVIEPVGRLVGELGDEELQDGSQVALAAHRRHLHRSGHGRVTVTATGTQRERERERERESCYRVWNFITLSHPSQPSTNTYGKQWSWENKWHRGTDPPPVPRQRI